MNKNNLIFEELTISDEVVEVGNELMKDIVNGINKDNGRYYTNYLSSIQTLFKEYIFKLKKPIFGNVQQIHTMIHFFQSKDEVRQTWETFNFGGTFNMQNHTIYLVGYGIKNKIQTDFISGLLYHELKHVYQESLYKSKDLPFVYKVASNIIDGQIQIDNPFIKGISSLLYYFNRNEINANMESLYQYMLNDKPSDLKHYKAPILQEFEYYQNLYEEILALDIDKQTLVTVYNLYGKTFKQLMRVVKYGIDYFNDKKRKVFARYHQNILSEMREKLNLPKRFFIR